MSDGEIPPPAPPRRTRSVLVVVVALAALALPYFAWNNSRFGRHLSRAQIEARLNAEVDPRDTQHALSQVVDRLAKGDPEGQLFRELVVSVASHPRPEVRRMVAWTMGHDQSEIYHEALRTLVEDSDLGVRRNAACALAKYRDPIARPVLLGMLDTIDVVAPADGKLVALDAKADSTVSVGRSLGKIEDAAGKKHKIRPPFNGSLVTLDVSVGDQLSKGQIIAHVAPDSGMVEAALVGLQLVGKAEDSAALQAYAADRVPGMPRSTGELARATQKSLAGR